LDDETVIDFMLKPAVGVVMVGVSSLASCFKIVVLPELSRPRRTIRNSRSDDDLNFLRSDKSPFTKKKKYKKGEKFSVVKFFNVQPVMA
jgi:hypothetical protein